MVKRVGGQRRKTRYLAKKRIADKGKVNLTRYFQKLKTGEKVQLVADFGIHEGPYFRRFHGKAGIIKSQRGRCYEVQVKDNNKSKLLIIHPIHLKRI